MSDFTLAVGTHDPQGFAAGSDVEAVRYAVALIEARYADDLRRNPQDVVTLMGGSGLISQPGERLDQFVQRVPGAHTGIDPDTMQPGDANIPDCNGQ
jgi:hypothetical protein